MTIIGKDAKHPDVHPGTPEEKLEDAKNLSALRPRQTLYMKIRAYGPIESSSVDAFLEAADAFERACRKAELEPQWDVTVSEPAEPLIEPYRKREAERQKEREEYRRTRREKAEPKAEPKR